MAAGRSAAQIVIDILINAGAAKGDIDSLADKFSGMGKRLAGAAAGIFAFDKLKDGISAAVSAAADLQQVQQATDKVFKGASQAVTTWAKDTQDSIRLSTREYEQLSVSMAAMLRGSGEPLDVIAQKTRNLLQASADFGAIFNRNVGDVANAVRGSLAGEYDELQNMGVAISGNIVKLEAQAIAMKTGADATSDAVLAQARYNVILADAAQYTGAAATESNTFTGQLEAFKTQLDNTAGAIGGPLLGALGDLLARTADLQPAFEAVGSVLTTFIAGVVSLPTPILAGVAALAAMMFIVPQIAGMFAALGASMSSFATQVAARMTAAAGSMGVFAASARVAGAALLSAFGGIPGVLALIATAIAGVAFFKWAQDAAEATSRAQELDTALQGLVSTLSSGGDVREDRYRALDAAWKDLIKDATTLDQKAKIAGTSLGKILDGLSGDKGQAESALKDIDTQIEALKKSIETPPDLGSWAGFDETIGRIFNSDYDSDARQAEKDRLAELESMRQKLIELNPQFDAATAKQSEMTDVTNDSAQATEDAAKAEEARKDAIKALNEMLDQQGDILNRIADRTAANTILNDLAAANERAARAADIFNASMDQAYNRNRTYQQTTLDTTASIEGVASAFKDAAEAGQINKEALMNWDIGGLAEAGDKSRALASELLGVTTQYGEFVTAAFEASGGQDNFNVALGAAHVAADTFRAKFVDAMTAVMGGTDAARAEAEKLADSMGILDAAHIDDKQFDIIAEDEAALQKAKLWETIKFNDVTMQFEAQFPAGDQIAADLNAKYGLIKPDPVKLSVEIGEPTPPPGLFGRYLVGGDLAVLPTVNVPTAIQPPTSIPPGPVGAAAATGAAQTAPPVTIPLTVESSALAGLQGAIADIQGKSVNLIVTADTGQAWSAVQLLSAAASALPVIVHVQGDSVPVNNTIRAVIGGTYSTTVHLMGDSVPVNNTIRAVIGGQYSTTVHIQGDSGPVNNTLRAVIGGSYQTTVTIVANAAPFWAVYNSLPTSKTVTMTTVQQTIVQAPTTAPALAAAFAAPMGFSAMSAAAMTAPTLRAASSRAISSSRAAQGSGTMIIVQGALDPDAVARQIANLLKSRDRRSGSVNVGKMRTRVGGGLGPL